MKIVLFIIVLVVVILVFSILFGKKGGIGDISPSQIESQLVEASKKYARANTKVIPKNENESNKIKSELLEERGYLKELKYKNEKCSGYVDLIYKKKEIMFIPFIKCGKSYETVKLANYIIDNEPIVSSNDGLYKMGDKYIFRGEVVNNYIMIGNKLYRIMEINENKEMKLISNKKSGIYFVWDNRYNIDKKSEVGINNYFKSRLKEKIDYITKNNNYDENSNDNFFSKQEFEKMIPHDICVGKRPVSYSAIDSSNECQTISHDEYISLITVSDYARASIDSNCKTIYDRSCSNYNYLSKINSYFYTTTAVSDNSYEVYYINGGVANRIRTSKSFIPNIVIYIDSNSIYLSGDGSQNNPYILKENNATTNK